MSDDRYAARVPTIREPKFDALHLMKFIELCEADRKRTAKRDFILCAVVIVVLGSIGLILATVS